VSNRQRKTSNPDSLGIPGMMIAACWPLLQPELALTINGPRDGHSLQDFLARASKAEVVSFFRGIVSHMKGVRRIGAKENLTTIAIYL